MDIVGDLERVARSFARSSRSCGRGKSISREHASACSDTRAEDQPTDGQMGRVVAALSLCSDGLCLLYTNGEERKMSWGMARELVEAEFDAVTWAEMSNGVWVARTFA